MNPSDFNKSHFNFSQLNLSKLSDTQLFNLVQAWVTQDPDNASRLQDAIGSALFDADVVQYPQHVEKN